MPGAAVRTLGSECCTAQYYVTFITVGSVGAWQWHIPNAGRSPPCLTGRTMHTMKLLMRHSERRWGVRFLCKAGRWHSPEDRYGTSQPNRVTILRNTKSLPPYDRAAEAEGCRPFRPLRRGSAGAAAEPSQKTDRNGGRTGTKEEGRTAVAPSPRWLTTYTYTRCLSLFGRCCCDSAEFG